MSAVVTELIQILASGITALGSAIGSGLNSTVTAAFLDTSGDTLALSTFGGVIAAFGAIALAVGLTTLVVRWIMSLGGRN